MRAPAISHAVTAWWFLLQHALAQLIVSPINGQAFVDAITEFGNTGQDTVILLRQGQVLSLAGAVIKDVQLGGRKPFSSGTLTIMPGPGNSTSPTVLDTAMAHCMGRHKGACIPFSGSARLYVQYITLVNLADRAITVDVQGVFNVYTAVGPSFLVSSDVYQAFIFTGVTMYIRHADMTTCLGGLYMQLTPFPDLLTRFQLPNTAGATHSQALAVTPYSVTLLVSSFPGILYQNSTLKSIADPGDPLLQSMRATGRLMAPKTGSSYTNWDNVTQPLFLNSQVPLWAASDGLSWLNALSQATTQAYLGSILGIPIVVQLCGTATLAGVLLPPPIRPLTQTLVLAGCGPTNTTFLTEGILDLSSNGTVMPVAPSGQLFMQNMRLRNLPAQPLPSSGSPSVFPLAAVPVLNTATSTVNLIQMFDMTLELPELDYLALATLAVPSLASVVNATVQAHAAALKAGFSSLLFGAAPQSLTSLTAVSCVGWGLNATYLNLVPAYPYTAYALSQSGSSALASAAAPREAQGQANKHYNKLAVIVSTTVAGLMTVVAAVSLGFVYGVHHRQRAASRAARPSGTSSGASSDLPHLVPPTASPETVVPKEKDRQQPEVFIELTGAMHHAHLPVTQPSQLNARDVQQLQSFCEELAAVTTSAHLSQSRHGPDTGQRQVAVVFTHLSQQQLGSQRVSSVTPPSQEAHSQLHESSELQDVAGSHGAAAMRSRQATTLTEIADATSSNTNPADQVLISGVLGQGAAGTVYSGTWQGLEVALKVMLFEMPQGNGPGMGAEDWNPNDANPQAITETLVAVSLDHPNVVRTHHYVVQAVTSQHSDKTFTGLQVESVDHQMPQTQVYKLFLIMERCRTSLAHLLLRRSLHAAWGQPNQVSVVFQLLLNIARGLQYLHSKNIVHGDLKPGNVLIADGYTSPTGVLAKLADFGLSARMAVGATHVSNYRSGTPFYVAPEVVDHCQTSPAADVYSFGIIMWQLYTGDAPYVQPDKGPYVANPLFPRFDPGNPPPQAYTALLHQCLSRDPKQRPLASDIIHCLETLQEQVRQGL